MAFGNFLGRRKKLKKTFSDKFAVSRSVYCKEKEILNTWKNKAVRGSGHGMHQYNLRSNISTYWKNSENIFHCIVHLHIIFIPYKNNFKKVKNKVAILITDFSDFGTKINFGTHHAPGLFLGNKDVVTHKFWVLSNPLVMYFLPVFTIYPRIAHVSYIDLVSKGVFPHENMC